MMTGQLRFSRRRKFRGIGACLGGVALATSSGAHGQAPPVAATPAAAPTSIHYPHEWRPLVDELAPRLRRDYFRIRPGRDAAEPGQDAAGIFDDIARAEAEVGEIASAEAWSKKSVGVPFSLSRWIAANQALAGDTVGAESTSREGGISEPDYLFLGQMWARAGDNSRSAANFELVRLRAPNGDYAEGSAKYLGSLIEAEIVVHQPACARAAITDLLEVAQRAPGSPLKVRIYNSVARLQAAIGDMSAARGTVAAALHAALGIPEPQWRSGALAEVAFYQAKWGSPTYPASLFRQAIEAALQIPDSDTRDEALLHVTGVIRAVADRASPVPMIDWRDKALAPYAHAARSVGDPHKRARALQNQFFAEAKWGNADAAATTFSEYRRIALGLRDKSNDDVDVDETDAMWESLSSAQARAGDFNESRRSLDNIAARDAAEIAEGEAAIAAAEATRGKTAEAWRTASRVRSPQGRVNAYLAVAEAQVDTHSIGLARKTIAECLRRARNISDGGARFRVFERIGDLQVSIGDVPAARRSWNLARKAVPQMPAPGDAVRVMAYLSLADSQLRAGDRDGAILTYRAVSSAVSTTWEPADVARWLGHTALLQRKLGLAADAKAMLDAADRLVATIASGQPVRSDPDYLRAVVALARERSLIGDVSGTTIEMRRAVRLAESDAWVLSPVGLEIVSAALADIACPAALREPRQPDYLARILLDEDATI